MGNPPISEQRDVICCKGSHSVTCQAATRHRWTCSTLTSAGQAGTRYTYPEGMESW